MSTTTNSSSSTYTYCSSASTTANGTAALDCYNVIDTSQLITSIWLSAAGGLAILLLFAILRNNSTWRSIYHKRATQISDLVRRPWPFLNRTLVDRCFSFLYPIFATNDAGLFLSAGIDSLMIVRTNLLGVQLFAPLTLVVLPVLLPLYRTGGYLESSETSANADSIMLYTLANIGNKNNKLWAAIVFSPFIMLWALRCLYFHYCSFAAFRLLQGLLVDMGVGPTQDGWRTRTLLGDRPSASWRGLWRGVRLYFSPSYMHRRDLEAIARIKAAGLEMEKAGADAGADGRGADLYFRADEVTEPFHPYWQLPEQQPRSVNGALKPYGLLLGKSNWAYRKRMLVRAAVSGDEGDGAGDGRLPPATCVSIRNVVVMYRDAGAYRLNRNLGGIFGRGEEASERLDHGSDGFRRVVLPDEDGESFVEAIEDESHAAGSAPTARLARLEAALRHVFGDELLDVVPVYEPRAVDKLMHKLDETYGAIHKLESDLTRLETRGGSGGGGGRRGRGLDLEAPVEASPPVGTKKDKMGRRLSKLHELLETKRSERSDLEAAIADERARALECPVDVAGFAIFSSHRAARLAASGDIGLVPSIDMTSEVAPCPDSINFHALPSTKTDHQKALMWTMPFFVLLMLFPIGALTGALANLTVAVCGGTPETNPIYWAGYCNAGKPGSFILTTIVPVSISAFWDTFVMPLCCQQLTQRLRIAASLPQMDTSITIQLYVYTVFNTFFLGVIGGAAITGVGEAIENGQIAELIGESLPTASNYFLNYAAVHALFTNLFRYFWPHDGTVLFQFLRLVKLAAQPFTERERWIIRSTPSFRSARHYASFLLIFIIGTSYAVISPFVLPLSLAFFVTSWMAWKYNSMHFYQPNYESRGEVWLVVYRCYVATLGVSVFFTVCVIVSKRFFWQAGVMAIVDVLVLHMGLDFVRRNVSKYVGAFPLQHTKQVKIVSPLVTQEIRWLYTPSSLRPGAAGWFPEGGKVWEKYGLPF